MSIDPTEYQRIEASFVDIFGVHKGSLQRDAVDHVQHYLDVAELEMAYESFVLSLIEEGIAISKQEKVNLRNLGKTLGLHESSVFRDDFWSFASAVFLWSE